MFRKKTVFLLGAGASWHYGYPTGEGLVLKAIAKARQIARYFSDVSECPITNALSLRPQFVERHEMSQPGFNGMREQWKAAAQECSALAERLEQVNPLVIDYFLGQSKSLQAVGKFVIALVLLECEAASLRVKGNLNRLDIQPEATPANLNRYKDRWVRFVIQKLVDGCDTPEALLSNDVTFVTFNYDASFEWDLYHGLCHIEMFEHIVGDFFGTHPTMHIYGKIRDYPGGFDPIATGILPFDPGSYRNDGGAVIKQRHLTTALDAAYAASIHIRTIGPNEKGTEEKTIEKARNAIAEAECIYILGYGFDEQNSKLLGLDLNLRLDQSKSRIVLFTNFDNINRVNKRASQLLFGDIEHFSPATPFTYRTSSSFGEKSIRDVYGALELDFDMIEN